MVKSDLEKIFLNPPCTKLSVLFYKIDPNYQITNSVTKMMFFAYEVILNKILGVIVYISVMRVGSDTFSDPIFQKVLQK